VVGGVISDVVTGDDENLDLNYKINFMIVRRA